MRRIGLMATVVALMFLLLDVLPPAQAETVVTRKRIGNNSEGVTYVTTGQWKNRVVAIDGNDVLAINLGGPGENIDGILTSSGSTPTNGALRGPGWKKIFDVLALGPDARIPRGIAFLPERNEFVFGGFVTTNLFRTDQFGNPLAPIVLTGLANPADFAQYEGLTWIPADAPEHPNTIAAILIRASDFLAHVIYIRLDGTVEAEITPQPGSPLESYMCGITYQPQRPGTLLITECASGNYAMDQEGNLLDGGPILPAPAGSGDLESVFVDRFGRVFLGSSTLPTRFPDLPLSSPVIGRQSVQSFDAGAGLRLFTGGAIYDSSGTLLHVIDQAALGVTVGVNSGTWISDTYAVIDVATSTVIIFTLS